MPRTVRNCWIVFLCLILLWVLLYFIVGERRRGEGSFGGSTEVYDDYKKGNRKWPIISRVLAYSFPIPMIYLLFWDMVLKPHISFESYTI